MKAHQAINLPAKVMEFDKKYHPFCKKVFAILIIILSVVELKAQQYNSDNYLVMPHGIGTFILTNGERNAGFTASLALIPKFEFALVGLLFWGDSDTDLPQHFTTSAYVKYSVWVNRKKNGGLAALAGLGRAPSYFTNTEFIEPQNSYWINLAYTLPMFGNKVSFDLFPGVVYDIDYGEDKEKVWGFTYSTRLTFSHLLPKLNLIGELFGSEDQSNSDMEYKLGIQWEPNDFIIPSITYGANLKGNQGAGFEIGVLIYTPPFLKKDYVRNNKIDY